MKRQRKRMTKQEQKVMDNLVKAWNEYVKLPVIHPDHNDEFRHAIHQAQYLIMARPHVYRGKYKGEK